MKIRAEKAICDHARSSHDLYILNMFLFNLTSVVGILAYTIGGFVWILVGVAVALLISFGILGYIWNRSATMGLDTPWLVMIHWKLTVSRSKLLLIGYAISASIISIGVVSASGMDDITMQNIMHTIFIRVGIVPALALILVTIILEGQAMHLANNGIAPASLVKKFPPPADVSVLDEHNETGE